MKNTKQAYERELNDLFTPGEAIRQAVGQDEGHPPGIRLLRMGRYGSYLRKYDPIAFEVGYNEWIREKHGGSRPTLGKRRPDRRIP